jgi:hypothetical protein
MVGAELQEDGKLQTVLGWPGEDMIFKMATNGGVLK